MKLFVDDKRRGPKDWNTVRTITEAIRLLVETHVEELSLDCDCGYVHSETGRIADENFLCIAYVVRLLPEPPAKVYVHSSNSSAFDVVRSVVPQEIMVIKGYPTE